MTDDPTERNDIPADATASPPEPIAATEPILGSEPVSTPAGPATPTAPVTPGLAAADQYSPAPDARPE